MKLEELQPGDVVLVDRVGLDGVHRVFTSWITHSGHVGYGGVYYVTLAHGNKGTRKERAYGEGHDTTKSHITFIARPANDAERNLYINLGS